MADGYPQVGADGEDRLALENRASPVVKCLLVPHRPPVDPQRMKTTVVSGRYPLLASATSFFLPSLKLARHPHWRKSTTARSLQLL
jgi:hypothetical protein